MNKIISIGLLVGGIVAVVAGFGMSSSVKIAKYPYYSGGLSLWTILLLIVGIAAIIIGIVSLIRRANDNNEDNI
jgi:hypothetical protein